MSYPIKVDLIPGLPKIPYVNGVGTWNAVVNHSTATPNATAAAERTYEAAHFNEAFVHYFVDDISIIQVADTNYLCYGCGNGNKYGVVQIELCEFADPTRFKNSYDRYVWLTVYLLRQKGQNVIDKQTVYSHKDIAAKYGGSNHTDPIGYLSTHGISWAQHITNLQNEWNKQEAEAHPAVTTPTTLYRIRKSWDDAASQIGAFGDLNNAKSTADANPGYIVFDNDGKQVYPAVVVPPAQLYRVRKTWSDAASQIGAFSDIVNAKTVADANQGYAVYDNNGTEVYRPSTQSAQVTVHAAQPTPVQPAETAPVVTQPVQPAQPVVDHTGHHDIAGKADLAVEKMVGFVKQQNPNFADLEDVAKAFLAVGEKYGLRGDIAFAQSVLETHYFLFDMGTAVTPDQHNYAGIGVTSKGMKGNSFDTIEQGVAAQVQHLFAYASKDTLPAGEQALDPRFQYVTRGIAPHWEDLNNRWAANNQYGQEILAIYDKISAFVPPVVEQPKPVVQVPVVPEVIVASAQPQQPTDEKVNVSLLNKLMQAIIDFLAKFFK